MVTKKKQTTPSSHTFWWQSLFSLITEGILSDARAFIRSAEDQFKAFVEITIIRSLLILSAFVGYIFILVGMGEILDSFFRFPGAGTLFVGIMTLLLSFIVFSLVGSQKKR